LAAIAQIESGRRKDVRISSLFALATAMGITVDGLIHGQDERGLRHHALLFSSDEEFMEAALPAIQKGVEQSHAVLSVTAKARVGQLRDALGSSATEVVFVDSNDWYSSPAETLAAYRAFLDESIEHGRSWISIIGEPVWRGRSATEVRAWTRYEALLNISFASAPATIICPYDTRTIPAAILKKARQTHPLVTSKGVLVGSDAAYQPERLVLS
jgi:transcriptional regulator with XRE-family HTH domain